MLQLSHSWCHIWEISVLQDISNSYGVSVTTFLTNIWKLLAMIADICFEWLHWSHFFLSLHSYWRCEEASSSCEGCGQRNMNCAISNESKSEGVSFLTSNLRMSAIDFHTTEIEPRFTDLVTLKSSYFSNISRTLTSWAKHGGSTQATHTHNSLKSCLCFCHLLSITRSNNKPKQKGRQSKTC